MTDRPMDSREAVTGEVLRLHDALQKACDRGEISVLDAAPIAIDLLDLRRKLLGGAPQKLSVTNSGDTAQDQMSLADVTTLENQTLRAQLRDSNDARDHLAETLREFEGDHADLFRESVAVTGQRDELLQAAREVVSDPAIPASMVKLRAVLARIERQNETPAEGAARLRVE